MSQSERAPGLRALRSASRSAQPLAAAIARLRAPASLAGIATYRPPRWLAALTTDRSS